MGTRYETLNLTTLILIAIGMIAAVIVIAWGTRLSRRRKAAQAQIEEDLGTVTVSAGSVSDNDATDLPEAEAEPEGAEAPAPTPPVAPAPPPLAESEVVASAPEPEPKPVVPEPEPVVAEPEPVAPEPVAPPPPPSAREPAGADDFTRLKGLGPKVAARLNELGMTSYTQLAALSPAEVDALDAEMGPFKGRLARDRWVEQAGYLAKGDTAGFEAAFGKL